MTDAQKDNDATRFLILQFGNGNNSETAYKVLDVFDNEGAARKKAEELALANEGVKFGVFQKIGTARAGLKVEWKGAAV